NERKRRRKENNNFYSFLRNNTKGSKTSFSNRPVKYIFRSPVTPCFHVGRLPADHLGESVGVSRLSHLFSCREITGGQFPKRVAITGGQFPKRVAWKVSGHGATENGTAG
ncbi:MAG: hypothetical protein QM278_12115, partial [Pseudomonadota bacterium]|nr:hypothetical protein [Pseudomonadota bacterium]